MTQAQRVSVFQTDPCTLLNMYPRVGPYMGVTFDDTRGQYRIIVYAAFDAMGLIGTEKNGIAVLDNDRMLVLADELVIGNGYDGGSTKLAQHEMAELMLGMSDDDFANLINNSGRNRYEI